MKNIVLLVCALLLVCCSANRSVSMAGTYKAPEWSIPELVLARLKNMSVAANEHLDLKKDFTFTYSNCSINGSGHWKLNNDTLLVYFKKKRLIIDELNDDPKYKPATRCDSIPWKFFVSKNGTVIKYFEKRKNGRTMLVELHRY